MNQRKEKKETIEHELCVEAKKSCPPTTKGKTSNVNFSHHFHSPGKPE
jgi:hypothetical protein